MYIICFLLLLFSREIEVKSENVMGYCDCIYYYNDLSYYSSILRKKIIIIHHHYLVFCEEVWRMCTCSSNQIFKDFPSPSSPPYDTMVIIQPFFLLLYVWSHCLIHVPFLSYFIHIITYLPEVAEPPPMIYAPTVACQALTNSFLATFPISWNSTWTSCEKVHYTGLFHFLFPYWKRQPKYVCLPFSWWSLREFDRKARSNPAPTNSPCLHWATIQRYCPLQSFAQQNLHQTSDDMGHYFHLCHVSHFKHVLDGRSTHPRYSHRASIAL